MITGQVQIEIEAKPEVLFDLLLDPTKVSAWIPKITEMSLTPEGPIRKGFKGRSSFKHGRKIMEYEFNYYEYDKPNYFSCEATSRSEIIKMSYKFTPTEKGTHINFRFEFQPKGLLCLVEPFLKLLKGYLIKQEQRYLEAFKEYVAKNI